MCVCACVCVSVGAIVLALIATFYQIYCRKWVASVADGERLLLIRVHVLVAKGWVVSGMASLKNVRGRGVGAFQTVAAAAVFFGSGWGGRGGSG